MKNEKIMKDIFTQCGKFIENNSVEELLKREKELGSNEKVYISGTYEDCVRIHSDTD